MLQRRWTVQLSLLVPSFLICLFIKLHGKYSGCASGLINGY